MIFGIRRQHVNGLALGGGAARGWAHLGVIKYLEEQNIKPACIAGTSIGALIGGFYAADRLSVLEEIAATYTKRNYLALFDPGLFKSGFFQGEKITDFLHEHLGDIRIEDLEISFVALSTDLISGEEVVINRGSLATAIRASISIPAFFNPVVVNGQMLADGGLANPVPVASVRQQGAKKIIAVDLNSTIDPQEEEFVEGRHVSVLKVTMRSLCIIERQLAAAHYKVDSPDILIKPSLQSVRIYEFHKAAECMEKGYLAARETI